MYKEDSGETQYTKKEYRAIIKKSLDIKCYKHDFLLLTIAFVFLLVFSIAIFSTCLWNYKIIMIKLIIVYLVFLSLIYIPFILFYTSKILKILAYPESYIYTNVILANPCFTGRGACFIISVELSNVTIQKKTNNIFHATWKKPRLDDYLNKMVKIGYNTSSQEIIVIDAL